MRTEAEAVVRQGVPSGPLVEIRTAFMRYRGQGHEIAVPLAADRIDAAALRAAFDETYQRLFGRIIPKLEIEAVTWTLALSQDFALPSVATAPAATAAPEPSGTRAVIDPATGNRELSSLYERADLLPGTRLEGPAVIAEAGTSTIVPPGFSAAVGANGELILEFVRT
jgi:N-methylhydantoinase A